jgi:hypothetical protein
MLCRHTVPDWHRYVDTATDAAPIYAACRLLVKEGELASSPQAIGCAYWGRQRECPLYEGPGGRIVGREGRVPRPAPTEEPVAVETVWPVRAPGARDAWRWLLPGIEAASVALLLATAIGAIGILQGRAPGVGYGGLVLVAAVVSISALVLGRLRTWANLGPTCRNPVPGTTQCVPERRQG